MVKQCPTRERQKKERKTALHNIKMLKWVNVDLHSFVFTLTNRRVSLWDTHIQSVNLSRPLCQLWDQWDGRDENEGGTAGWGRWPVADSETQTHRGSVNVSGFDFLLYTYTLMARINNHTFLYHKLIALSPSCHGAFSICSITNSLWQRCRFV